MRRPLNLIWLVLLSCFAGTLSANENLPDLGDSESAVLSLAREQELGEIFLMAIRRSGSLVEDPILKYFVKNNLHELAEHSSLKANELTSVIVDSQELQAFAVPGGVIGIYLGLFKYADDIHEYSSVVAHELAHLSQRHFARQREHQQRSGQKQGLAWITSGIILSMIGEDIGFATMGMASAIQMRDETAYSRHQEREADRVGMTTLAQAGFDPHGAVRLFNDMQEQQRYGAEIDYFLRSHPLTTERISDLRTKAQELASKEFAPSIDYQLLKVRVANRAFASAVEALTHAQSLPGDSASEQYALALAHVRGGEYDKAISLMRPIYESEKESMIVTALYADLLIESEESEKALELINNELKNTPGIEHLAVLKARALRSLERYEEAAKTINGVLDNSPNDIHLWSEYSDLQGLGQNLVGVHTARAKVYDLQGNFPAAMTSLQLALKENNQQNNRIEQSIQQEILEIRGKLEQQN